MHACVPINRNYSIARKYKYWKRICSIYSSTREDSIKAYTTKVNDKKMTETSAKDRMEISYEKN
jgi:hypothetical protein